MVTGHWIHDPRWQICLGFIYVSESWVIRITKVQTGVQRMVISGSLVRPSYGWSISALSFYTYDHLNHRITNHQTGVQRIVISGSMVRYVILWSMSRWSWVLSKIGHFWSNPVIRNDHFALSLFMVSDLDMGNNRFWPFLWPSDQKHKQYQQRIWSNLLIFDGFWVKLCHFGDRSGCLVTDLDQICQKHTGRGCLICHPQRYLWPVIQNLSKYGQIWWSDHLSDSVCL